MPWPSSDAARTGHRGIDISGALIGKAADAERNDLLVIRYVHADVASPAGLGAATFDAVTRDFGFSDIDDPDRCTSLPDALRQASLLRVVDWELSVPS
jgi:ubiquinone/menaquinone biosynthesis C-methylase UbiE